MAWNKDDDFEKVFNIIIISCLQSRLPRQRSSASWASCWLQWMGDLWSPDRSIHWSTGDSGCPTRTRHLAPSTPNRKPYRNGRSAAGITSCRVTTAIASPTSSPSRRVSRSNPASGTLRRCQEVSLPRPSDAADQWVPMGARLGEGGGRLYPGSPQCCVGPQWTEPHEGLRPCMKSDRVTSYYYPLLL